MQSYKSREGQILEYNGYRYHKHHTNGNRSTYRRCIHKGIVATEHARPISILAQVHSFSYILFEFVIF